MADRLETGRLRDAVRMRGVAIPLLLSFVACAISRAAENETLPRIVRLDVVVRDGHGRIVRDLDARTFSLEENGASVPVRDVRFAAAAQNDARVALVFDQMGSATAAAMRAAAEEVLAGGVGANTRFAVFEIRENLRVLQDYTADRKALEAAIEAATGKRRRRQKNGASAPATDAPTGRALEVMAEIQRDGRIRPSLAALIALARAHQDTPGRKAVVFFSEGLPVADSKEQAFRLTVSAANQANVSIYAVDAAAVVIAAQQQRARESTLSAGLGTPQLTAVADDSTRTVTGLKQERLETRMETARRPPPADPSSPVLRELAAETGGFTVTRGSAVRSLRRVAEDATAYYELSYAAPGKLDGSYRSLKVAVQREKMAVQGRDGYFAVPDLPGITAEPFEAPLLEALKSAGPSDALPHEASALLYRNEAGAAPAQSLLAWVAGRDLRVVEDRPAELVRAHFSVLAVVRDSNGKIAGRLARDVPMEVSTRMAADLRRRVFTYTADLALPPGAYTLESVVKDQMAGKTGIRRSSFVVPAVSSALGMSTPSIAETLLEAEDGPAGKTVWRAGDKVVVPAGDGTVRGGPGAAATVFAQVYPAPNSTAPIELSLEVVRDGKMWIRGSVPPVTPKAKSIASLLCADVSKLPDGAYEARITASQGGSHIEGTTRLVIEREPGQQADAGPAAGTARDGAVWAPRPEELAAKTPEPEQQRLLEISRLAAVRYTERLPDFVCIQITRRLLDETGAGRWQNLGDISHTLTFYDGTEHYAEVAENRRVADQQHVPPSMTSAGEFGSVLRKIFEPKSQAKFGWLRADRSRGRRVQVFTYSVDRAHSSYRVSYIAGEYSVPVNSAYRGLLFIDSDTGVVRRLTLETEPLPQGYPVRQVRLALEYDEASVGGILHLLPLSVDINLRLRKKTVLRNEISFRAYRRFTAESRVLPAQP